MTQNAFDRWWQIDATFAEALTLPSGDQAAFLEEACAGDEALRREVEQLLAAHAGSEQYLEDPASWFEAPLLPGLDAAEEAAPAEGKHVGPYRLLGEVGRGGMGTVYLAERADGQFRQRVALKLIRGGLGTEDTLRRFRLEREILARLQHPHIARLLDGGVTDPGSGPGQAGQPYFVMEYIEGTPITAYCDEHTLDITRRLGLFRDVCAAVHYAHQNLVVHRDLTPHNILVTEQGHVKLLDFGIAKLLDEAAVPMTVPVTRQDVRIMTPEYASPEQVRGEAITTASDVYQLGVLLYVLLTGHHPHRIASRVLHEVQRIICEEDPEKPSTAVTRGADAPKQEPVAPERISQARAMSLERLRRSLAGDLDTIVLTAMRKEPERRYASAEAFAEDVRRHLEGLPVQARADTLGYRTAKFIRRHRVGVVAAFLAACSLVGGLTVALWQARVAEHERDVARQEASKAAQVTEFLIGVFEVADPQVSRGDTLTAHQILDRGARRIATELQHQPEVRATMMDVMGRVYQNLGLYKEALPLHEEALTIRQRTLGGHHPDVATSLQNLAWARHVRGDDAAADSLFRRALALRRELLGHEHPDVATTLHSLAWSLSARGDYAAADSLFRRALALRRKLLGREHPDVATTLHSLAWVLFLEGDYAAAEPVLREALAMRRKLLGDDHTDVAWSINNLAELQRAQGRYEAADSLFRQALAVRRGVLGEKHPRVVESLNNLATVRFHLGDFDAAEALFREALAMRRDVLGEEHPDIAVSLNNLASVLRRKEAYDEAEKLYREALRIARRQYGDAHPHVATFNHNLASVVRAMGGLDEAEALYREALDVMHATLPAGHPQIATSMVLLGDLLMDRGENRRAETLLREALALRREALPEDHWHIAEAESLLGACLLRLQRYAEAEPHLLESYRLLQDVRGAGDRRTARALDRVITLYEAWGKPEDAARYRAMHRDAERQG